MKREELDYAGRIFGFTIDDAPYEFNGKKYERKIVRVYLEDDEWWNQKVMFDSFWAPDLTEMANELENRLKDVS